MTTKSGHINGIYYQKWILTCDSSTENSSPNILVQALCVCIYCKLLLISGEGNGNPLQYSCLENPMDGGAWVHGVARSRPGLRDFTFTFHFHASEKEMATHSIILVWRIPGSVEPSGLPSVGSHGVGHDWSDLAAAAAALLISASHMDAIFSLTFLSFILRLLFWAYKK